MSEIILILGKSGSGKSYACRNLDPETTLLVSVDGKRYPFPAKGWDRLTADNEGGSLYHPSHSGSKGYSQIKKASEVAISKGKKTIVLDDTQFLMANEFFARAHEKSFDKFVDMGAGFHSLIVWARNLPEDVIVYFLHHSEFDSDGSYKVKTCGKMLDNQTSIEGKFTICLQARKNESMYELASDVPNESIFKCPPDLLPREPMENDLKMLDDSIRGYWGM